MNLENTLMMIPGPVPVAPRILRIMSKSMIGHRSKEFSAIYTESRQILAELFGTKNEIFVLSGSGSCAMEAAIGNVIGEKDTLLTIENGKFGERFREIGERYGTVKSVKFDWTKGESIELDKVENALSQGVKAVTLAHNDTSVGTKNPAKEIGELAKKYGALFIMDGVTTIGGDEVLVDKWGVDMIKIAVNGATGKMGSLIIENILRSNDLQLVAQIVSNMEKLKPDVLIDFSNASCAIEIIKACACNGSNIVIGTTGFSNEQQNEIKDIIKGSGITAVISPNFSIGVNVFWSLIAEAAKRFEDYDIEIIETHHNQKKDAPSGTAIKTAEIISENLGGKDFVYGRNGLSPRHKEIGIHAIRGGDIIGDHVVLFAGEGERLEIKHQAHSRQAFAKGALLAARWVMTAPGGMYSMKDVLGI